MMTAICETRRQTLMALAHRDYEKGLNSCAFFKMGNRATGEELVQETFMKTWSYLVKGGKIETMKAFLYHLLNCLIVDEYRKRKTTSLDGLVEKGFQPSSTHSEVFFNMNFLDGKSAILQIQRLPDTYKKIIKMRFVQDLSLQEMSLITGQTKNSLAVQVHRGLQKLKLLCGRRIV